MKKILIVEDDSDTLQIMELILKERGYAVISINREIAIEEISSIQPDLLIVDYWLPYSLGTEICARLKSNPSTKHIPVILYSANNNVERLAMSHGADAYIAKPFDLDALAALVAEKIL